MSYHVLARKWRPQKFADMVGQELTVRILQNSLEAGRIHHAYLFTGTRGVGKTTVARILAKALSCEKGPLAEPCGACKACDAIAKGGYVDLVEVDAASHTKVEETRELMESVPYAPASGRYRIYLIDEVHMLSGHSFNALLKTLEEPPEHVKFMLATTDPQKLPVTVLSRCLQFHLRHVDATEIASYLEGMLSAEGVECEQDGLRLIAEAASGSLRDAISMVDQAVAHGGGAVRTDQVREMLGVPERTRVLNLLQLLVEGSAGSVLEHAHALVVACADPRSVLKELLVLLHRVAVLQAVPGYQPGALAEDEALGDLAKRMKPEEVQLFYQAGVSMMRDFAAAPTPSIALEIVLLRMLGFVSFDPADSVLVSQQTGDAGVEEAKTEVAKVQLKPEPSQDAQPSVSTAPGPVKEASLSVSSSVGGVGASAAQPKPPPVPNKQGGGDDTGTGEHAKAGAGVDGAPRTQATVTDEPMKDDNDSQGVGTSQPRRETQETLLKTLSEDRGIQLLHRHLSVTLGPDQITPRADLENDRDRR